MKPILVLNGPNMNLLGTRQREIYGDISYLELTRLIKKAAHRLGFRVKLRQSNYEGRMVGYIQRARRTCCAIVINPAAYTHTSIAILDALTAAELPCVEVHMSDISKREAFRRVSYAGMACEAHYIGLGMEGYIKALEYLAQKLTVKSPG